MAARELTLTQQMRTHDPAHRCFTYYTATGAWPDLSNSEDQAKVGASVFAFVNIARFAVPLRVGLALSTTPWVDDNIVQPRSHFT